VCQSLLAQAVLLAPLTDFLSDILKNRSCAHNARIDW
jgi:hypothetical protein